MLNVRDGEDWLPRDRSGRKFAGRGRTRNCAFGPQANLQPRVDDTII